MPVGGDLALQLDQLLGPLVHPAEHAQPDRAQEDQERDHRQKRDQQLGVHRAGTRETRSTARCAGPSRLVHEALEVVAELLLIEPVAEILHAHNTRRSISVVSKVWSTWPSAAGATATP